MISAVTGLPAIIIEGMNNTNNEIDNSNKPKNNEQVAASKSNELSAGESLQKSTQKEEKGKKVSYEEFQKKLQDTLKDNNLMIEFSEDRELNKMIIKMVDTDTKEIVRQIPPDVALKVARIVTQTFGMGQIADAKVWRRNFWDP